MVQHVTMRTARLFPQNWPQVYVPSIMFVGRPPLIGHLATMSLTLIAAAALFAFGGERSAMASCGDYVMVGGHGMGHSDHPMPAIPTCHGPNCQRQAPLPTMPTKGLLSSPPGDLACCTQPQCTSRSTLSGGIYEQDLPLAESNLTPPLRPPCV